MIAVDTSALMAIVLNEAEADSCIEVLSTTETLLISSATVGEALVVAGRRKVGAEMTRLIDGLGFNIVPVTHDSARAVALAYERWGRGLHPAGLNLGDCFAYALAHEANCPRLFVGDDFSKTDITSAVSF